MRVSHERYVRDLRRYSLALRMITHGARHHTVLEWTGLPAERIRNLALSYARERGKVTTRHRGPSPHQISCLLTTGRMQSEAAAITGLCRMLEVIPAERVSHPRRVLPGVVRGERLCRAYELFRDGIGDSPVTLEHAVLLVMSVASGNELEVGRCVGCGALILVDRCCGQRRQSCSWCTGDEIAASGLRTDEAMRPAEIPGQPQRSLF